MHLVPVFPLVEDRVPVGGPLVPVTVGGLILPQPRVPPGSRLVAGVIAVFPLP